ncbi:MAG: hypothetical protein KJ049_13425 [Gammaproteobacteria bacterium]|jgi:hypothetical protein|nr:hypothetical protein [Gammaproteobacteria bacterium]
MRCRLTLVATIMGFVVACSSGSDPERPVDVPSSASWTGNVEGGVWLDCEPLPSVPDRYACRAWFQAGGMVSEGEYLLRRRSWNQRALRSEYSEPADGALPAFETFDGRWIFLKDEHVLLPDGVVSYPDSPGHGTRQAYSLGVETGAVEKY